MIPGERNRNLRVTREARPRRISVFERWRRWQRHHSQSAADSLARVLQQPAASLMAWLVIGIAIALPSSMWVVLDNIGRAGGALDSPARVSLFLAADVDEAAARDFAARLAERADIESVVFLSSDDALAEFTERSGMGDIVSSLGDNPLPHVLIVDPADDALERVDALQREFTAAAVVDEAILDMLWLKRLQALMDLGRRAVQLLAVLLLAAVLLVLGNTIRLVIESRRDEIVISKLVGGSDAFVRRPLLYLGLWLGLGGGAVAALLVALGAALLRAPVAALADAYQSGFELRGLGLVDSLQLVLLGAALGLLGAWLAVARHLRDIEPT